MSNGEGFGKMRWTVVKAIFRRGGVGLQLVSAVDSGELVVVPGGGKAVEGWRKIAGSLGELGGSIGKEIEAWMGLGLLEKEGEVLLNFQREKKKVLLENSLDFSSLSLGASKSDEGGLKGWLLSEDRGCWARWRF